MACEGCLLLSRGHIPQLQRPVPAPRHYTAPIWTKRHTADLCTVVLGSRALPDWLECRGGVSQEILDFLVFRVARLQQHRPGLGILFGLRPPTVALKANRPRCHHTRGKEVVLLLIRQCPLKPRF